MGSPRYRCTWEVSECSSAGAALWKSAHIQKQWCHLVISNVWSTLALSYSWCRRCDYIYVECESWAPTRMFRKCQSKGNSDCRETPTHRDNLSVSDDTTETHITQVFYSHLSVTQGLFQIPLLWWEEVAELKKDVFAKDHVEPRSHLCTMDSISGPSIPQRWAAWRGSRWRLKHILYEHWVDHEHYAIPIPLAQEIPGQRNGFCGWV